MKIKNSLVSAILVITIAFSFAPITSADNISSVFSTETNDVYSKICSSSNLEMYADMTTGNFFIKDAKNGTVWNSVPTVSSDDTVTKGAARTRVGSQLVLQYVYTEEMAYASNLETADSLSSAVIKCEKKSDGIDVTYNFEDLQFVIPVSYRLNKNGLVTHLRVSEITEGETARLISLQVLPSLGCATSLENGYIFVPDGSGALINFSEKSTTYTYEKKVFGNDIDMSQNYAPLNSESVYMPVFGIKKENAALLGIISSGAENCSICATPSSNKMLYNAVGTKFWYRVNSPTVMFDNSFANRTSINSYIESFDDNTVFEVTYRFLNGNKAEYSGMASEYRDYLEQNNQIMNSDVQPTFNVDIYGSQTVTATFLGFNYDKQMTLTSFDDTKEIISAIKNVGVDNLNIRLIGWYNSGVINKRLTGTIKPLRNLGGKSDLKSLISYLNENSINCCFESDWVYFRKGSMNSGLRTYYGEKITVRDSLPSVYAYTNDSELRIATADKVLSVSKKYFKNLTKSYKNIGLSSASIGTACFTNFNSRNVSQRAEYIDAVTTALGSYKNAGIPIVLEGANSYVFPYVNKILSVPTSSSCYDYFSESVPFYQMVLHGAVAMASAPIIQSVDTNVAYLKAIEYGLELTYSGIFEESSKLLGTELEKYYSSTYTLWLDKASEQYAAYYPLLNKISDLKIVSNISLSDDVKKTVYEDGTAVYVNYSDVQVSIDGVVIQPKNFIAVY